MGTSVGLVDVLTYDYQPSACRDLDVVAIDRLRRQPEDCPELLRNYMNRPGLDPGTLGADLGRPSASLAVHLSWSEASANLPTSAEVLSNLGLRLHNWLHELGSGVVGVMQFESSDGTSFELRIEG